MNSERMISQVRENIEKCGFCLKTDQFLLGLSGGIDSIVLFDILQSLTSKIVVAHLNHQLRPDADKDEVFVHTLARKQGLTCLTQKVDVNGYSTTYGLSIEEAARILRYQFLFEQASVYHCSVVMVAHNADDQVETVLMHLLRGTGLAGLKGMRVLDQLPAFSSEIPIMRPLLAITRLEIEEYQQEHRLSFREDKTNQDRKYHRNRIRHELIPILKTYNPNITFGVLRMADNLREDWEIIDAVQKGDWQNCVEKNSENTLIVSVPKLKALPRGRLRNLLRKLIAEMSLDNRDFGYDRIMDLIHFIEQPSERNEVELFGDFVGLIYQESLILGTKRKVLNWLQEIYPFLNGDGTRIEVNQTDSFIKLGGMWVLKLEFVELDLSLWKDIRNSGNHEVWCDASLINWPMTVRTVQAGDRFQPIGMSQGSLKVSDFYINEKLPGGLRNQYPLLESQDSIVWVVGKRISEQFKVTETTQTLLHISLIKKEE